MTFEVKVCSFVFILFLIIFALSFLSAAPEEKDTYNYYSNNKREYIAGAP